MDKQFSEDIREKLIEELANVQADCATDDAGNFIREIVMYGYKGYRNYTDVELLKEYKESYSQGVWGDLGEGEDLLIEAEAQMAIIDMLEN